MYQHILIPTDGSELSERVARDGVNFAKTVDARLTVVHTTPVFYPPDLAGHAAYTHALEHEEQSNKNVRQALNAIEWIARDAGVPIERPPHHRPCLR